MFENGQYRVTLWLKFRRGLLRFFFGSLMRIVFKMEFEGLENVPKSGAYIIAYNHTSLIEPPILLAFWPTQPEALSGHDVWDRPGQGQLVKIYGATPIKRGQYDRKVFDIMSAQLKAGQSVAISPEGGQSPVAQMRQAHAGVAYLIEKMDVPVIPVGISGSYKGILKDSLKGVRPQIKVKVGEMFTLPPIEGKGQAKREARQRNADQIMVRIAELLPETSHGYYSGKVLSQ